MTLSPEPTDVPSLLRALNRSDPGRPRVTWYGPDGDRVELSARVLENWVAKTSNLLVEELDAGPATRVRLDLPPHWRTVVWALSTWAVGARLVRDGDADVAVTAGPEEVSGGGRVVAVALPALARSVPDLPRGAVDYNAEVSGFDDVFVPDSPAALPPAPRRWPERARVLVAPPAWDLAETVLGPLLVDGSLVLAPEPVPAEVLAAEKVTDRA